MGFKSQLYPHLMFSGCRRSKWGVSIVTWMWTQTWAHLLHLSVECLKSWTGAQWGAGVTVVDLVSQCWGTTDGKTHNQALTPSLKLETEGLVSCGKQPGFRAKKKPGHRYKAGVSLRSGRWEGLPLLWRKEESWVVGEVIYLGSSSIKAMKNPSGRGSLLFRCLFEVVAIQVATCRDIPTRQQDQSHPCG